MNALAEWLITPVFWNWLILTALLLLLEAFTISLFFMFWGFAALLMAGITAFFPELSLPWQILGFSLFSLIFITLWWILARHWQKDPQDKAGKLNNRGRNLIGRQFILQTPIRQGYGRIQIDDSLWTVHGEDMPAGSKIEITTVDSLILDVRKID